MIRRQLKVIHRRHFGTVPTSWCMFMTLNALHRGPLYSLLCLRYLMKIVVVLGSWPTDQVQHKQQLWHLVKNYNHSKNV